MNKLLDREQIATLVADMVRTRLTPHEVEKVLWQTTGCLTCYDFDATLAAEGEDLWRCDKSFSELRSKPCKDIA